MVKATHRSKNQRRMLAEIGTEADHFGNVIAKEIQSDGRWTYAVTRWDWLEPIPAPPTPKLYDYESWRELQERHGAALWFRFEADGYVCLCPAFRETGVGRWTWEEVARRDCISTDYGRTWRKAVRE